MDLTQWLEQPKSTTLLSDKLALLSKPSAQNGTDREVEAHVARAPLLSLFRREEPVDGGDSEPYTLHSYRSTSTPFIDLMTSPH